MSLDDSIHREIVSLCKEGDELANSGDYPGALEFYFSSWNLLPEPKEDYAAATWILAAMGDAFYYLQDYPNLMKVMSNALLCLEGLGNPFIHFRLGQAAFEMGEMDRAKDELARAYLGAGREIFAQDDPKYFNYLEQFMMPMPGEDSL